MALTKKQSISDYADIYLRIPKEKITGVKNAIENMLTLANIRFSMQTEFEEQRDSIDLNELFPDLHSGSAIKGLRYREGLTQEQLARKINVKRHHISEMENGKRAIGKEMAKRLSNALETDYKVFL
ncbi:helix-turn-helix transcriptional regulator [Desulfobacterales bacterium HSG17]|nr:helix-turn-helix transcriptional regulator [Desulfobacterales bacterium HSG17]